MSSADLKPINIDDTVALKRLPEPKPLREALTQDDRTVLHSVAATDPALERALNYLLGSQATPDEVSVLERALLKLEQSSAFKVHTAMYSEADEVAGKALAMFRRVRKLRLKFTDYRAATERWSNVRS